LRNEKVFTINIDFESIVPMAAIWYS